MKKIITLIILCGWFWLCYETIGIMSLVSSSSHQFGKFELQDRHGHIITELPLKNGLSIAYTESIDTPLIKNIIFIEDRRFFSHYWVDIIGKLWALRENYTAGTIVRGGSTITEQYIKNLYFPHAPRTIYQKIIESYYAIVLELEYTKEEILRKYLDSVYMGNGLYGIETAHIHYFWGEDIQNHQSEIITRIKYPNLWENALKYMGTINEKLSLTGSYTTLENHEKPIYKNLFPLLTERIEKEITLYCSGRENMLENFLISSLDDLCKKESISVMTSIDAELSLKGENILGSALQKLEEKNIHNGSIYIWSEKEKKVITYIGNNKQGRENAVDMITRKRSVWSILKPFIYKMSIDRWAEVDDYILDDTVVYETIQSDQNYVPQNYIPKSYGPIRLWEALGNSLNSATVRLSEFLGIGRIYDYYRSIGLELDHDAWYYGYGISLGAVELSLENVVSGYRSMTHLDEIWTFLIFDILRDTSNRAQTFGINSILNTSIPLAVKTGTSTDFRDNWTIGYTDDIIIGIWVGNTNNEPMDDVSWVSGAWPIYHAIAEELIRLGYIELKDYTAPAGVIYDYVCLDVGCLQKRWLYKRPGQKNRSEPLQNIYYKEDFITPLTQEEIKKWKIR